MRKKNKNSNYIDNSHLQDLLRKTYDGDEFAFEEFLSLSRRIAMSIYVSKYKAQIDIYDNEDAVEFSQYYLIKQILNKKLDPDKNLFGLLNTHHRYKFYNFLHTANKSENRKQLIIENAKEEFKEKLEEELSNPTIFNDLGLN